MNRDTLWRDIKDALGDAYRELIGFAIAAVEAVVLLVVATVVARVLRGRTRRSLERSAVGANVAALIANGVAIGVYVLAASFVLGLFGANWTALLAVLGAGTLAISLALQDVLKNFVAGVYLLLERPFTIGDRVRIRDIEGQVEGIDIRTTMLRNAQEERVLVPNATVFAEIVTNRSAYGAAQTAVRLKGVNLPLDALPDAIADALAGLDGLRQPPPRAAITAAGAEGAEVTVTVSHAAGADVAPLAIARLRERFPEATVITGAP